MELDEREKDEIIERSVAREMYDFLKIVVSKIFLIDWRFISTENVSQYFVHKCCALGSAYQTTNCVLAYIFTVS